MNKVQRVSEKEMLDVISKESYDRMKLKADELNIKFLTKYRKGIKVIKVGPIIL